MKTHETSYKTRCFIQALRFEAGWTYERIARNQGLGVSTVWDICRGPATPKKRKGRPLAIDTPTRKRLVFTATQDDEHRQMSFKDIADICGVKAGEKTLRKAFATEGYRRQKADKLNPSPVAKAPSQADPPPPDTSRFGSTYLTLAASPPATTSKKKRAPRKRAGARVRTPEGSADEHDNHDLPQQEPNLLLADGEREGNVVLGSSPGPAAGAGEA